MRRRRYSQRRGGGSGSIFLVVLFTLAIATGYGGTKYFIGPYLLEGGLWNSQENQESQVQETVTSGSGIVSGQQEIKEAEPKPQTPAVTPASIQTTETAVVVQTPEAPTATGKFAVQFGSFSTQGAAEKAVSDLAAKGIKSSVFQRNGSFKVVGTAFDTKELARAEAEKLRASAGDVYVIGL